MYAKFVTNESEIVIGLLVFNSNDQLIKKYGTDVGIIPNDKLTHNSPDDMLHATREMAIELGLGESK